MIEKWERLGVVGRMVVVIMATSSVIAAGWAVVSGAWELDARWDQRMEIAQLADKLLEQQIQDVRNKLSALQNKLRYDSRNYTKYDEVERLRLEKELDRLYKQKEKQS